MRSFVITSFIFLLFCGLAESYNIPVFSLPPSNYRLFNYKGNTVTVPEKIVKKQSIQKGLDLTVYGVFHTKNASVALIGTKICKQGDVIDGYKISKIEGNKVVFVKDGVKIIKSVQGQSFLKANQ